MLILVCGPSGAGKSTLISNLFAKGGYRVIGSLTTRPARPDDEWKTSVSQGEFLAMRSSLFRIKEAIHGHLYGELYHDIMLAGCTQYKGAFLLDMGLANYRYYRWVPSQVIVLLPDRPQTLERNLIRAKRAERIDHALLELQEWQTALNDPQTSEFFRVVTSEGKQEEVTERCHQRIMSWLNVDFH